MPLRGLDAIRWSSFRIAVEAIVAEALRHPGERAAERGALRQRLAVAAVERGAELRQHGARLVRVEAKIMNRIEARY